ncbi:hypothetical protein EX30DRAFT_375180 [Ascodesmis nigricans]|uniref:Uncharacterized protein n=1 Tax=Ascodesmis nigricans TaxID=341454 RepID=A0A4S2MIY5_9PEZI|nr:hypothetical protein EX30DRAFT_375180 [Ascodesmis nigricans]
MAARGRQSLHSWLTGCEKFRVTSESFIKLRKLSNLNCAPPESPNAVAAPDLPHPPSPRIYIDDHVRRNPRPTAPRGRSREIPVEDAYIATTTEDDEKPGHDGVNGNNKRKEARAVDTAPRGGEHVSPDSRRGRSGRHVLAAGADCGYMGVV